MKFVLDELSASTFGVEHNLSADADTPRTMELYFGPSEDVRGTIEVANGTTHFKLTTEGPLRLARVVAPLGDSRAQANSDLRLQTVDMDLKMRGAIFDGHASFAQARADVLRVSLPALDEFAASDVLVKDLDLQADAGLLQFRIASLRFALLPMMIPGGSIRLERVQCEDISIALSPRGAWEVNVARLRVGRVAYNFRGVEGSLEDLRVDKLAALAHGDGPTLRAESISAESVHARSQDVQALFGAPKSPDKAMPKSGPNEDLLALLDLLSGTFNVDIITAVDLPILPSWRAKHRVRVLIDEGAVGYEALEKGMGKLADAVLDFHVDEHTLKLDKDVPLVPFDRQTLVRWPLPERERALAERGRVRLARLAQPVVKVKSNPKGKDKGVRFLEEISAHKIDVSLRVAHQEAVKLPAGATLSLGDSNAAGIESLVVKGNIVYRTDEAEEDGRVQLGLRHTNFHLAELLAAGRRISAGVQVESCALQTNFLDIKPTSFELNLERTKITLLKIAPSYAAAHRETSAA